MVSETGPGEDLACWKPCWWNRMGIEPIPARRGENPRKRGGGKLKTPIFPRVGGKIEFTARAKMGNGRTRNHVGERGDQAGHPKKRNPKTSKRGNVT